MMNKLKKSVVDLVLRYLSSNPMDKLPELLNLAEKLDRGNLHASSIQAARKWLLDENGVWYHFVEDLFRDVDIKIIQKLWSAF